MNTETLNQLRNILKALPDNRARCEEGSYFMTATIYDLVNKGDECTAEVTAVYIRPDGEIAFDFEYEGSNSKEEDVHISHLNDLDGLIEAIQPSTLLKKFMNAINEKDILIRNSNNGFELNYNEDNGTLVYVDDNSIFCNLKNIISASKFGHQSICLVDAKGTEYFVAVMKLTAYPF